MANVQQTLTDQQVKMLMRQLRRIATALEDPRPTAISKEPSLPAAARNLDYLALRQLMGRARPEGVPNTLVSVGRKKTAGGPRAKATISVGPLPDGAAGLAVFTRPGEPDEVLPLAGHPTPYAIKTGATDYTLSTVTNDQAITRLEFRRSDGFPLALGPRLPAAV